jgi:hypothetical protein
MQIQRILKIRILDDINSRIVRFINLSNKKKADPVSIKLKRNDPEDYME